MYQLTVEDNLYVLEAGRRTDTVATQFTGSPLVIQYRTLIAALHDLQDRIERAIDPSPTLRFPSSCFDVVVILVEPMVYTQLQVERIYHAEVRHLHQYVYTLFRHFDTVAIGLTEAKAATPGLVDVPMEQDVLFAA